MVIVTTIGYNDKMAAIVLKAWCDGSITKNPGGVGGFAALVDDGTKRWTLTGAEANSTSNRAEIMAVIMLLTSLPPASEVVIHSDSNYVVLGVMERMHRWAGDGWRGGDRKPVKNQDLWQRLFSLCSTYKVKMVWVRGHSGIPENELVDKLAKEATKDFVKNNLTINGHVVV